MEARGCNDVRKGGVMWPPEVRKSKETNSLLVAPKGTSPDDT